MCHQRRLGFWGQMVVLSVEVGWEVPLVHGALAETPGDWEKGRQPFLDFPQRTKAGAEMEKWWEWRRSKGMNWGPHFDTELFFFLSLSFLTKIYYFKMLPELRGGLEISRLELGGGWRRIREFYGGVSREFSVKELVAFFKLKKLSNFLIIKILDIKNTGNTPSKGSSVFLSYFITQRNPPVIYIF